MAGKAKVAQEEIAVVGGRKKSNWDSIMTDLKTKQESQQNQGGNKIPMLKTAIPASGKLEMELRFLPAFDGGLPWVELFEHGFDDNNSVNMYERCPKTIGGECPICDAQKKMWADGRQDTYRSRKKKSKYYANVLVLADAENPENVGKVFLWRFGFQIMQKIKLLIEEEGTPAVVFDYEQGTDFKLRVTKKGDYPNYDESSFKRNSSALSPELQAIADAGLVDANLVIAPEKFRSYDEIAQDYNDRTGDAPTAWVKKNLGLASPSPLAKIQTAISADEQGDEMNDDFMKSLED